MCELTGAKVAVHGAERERVERGLKVMPRGTTAWGRVLGPCLEALQPLIPVPPTPVDLELGDVYSLAGHGIPGRVTHTPDHSPGSVSVVLDSGEAFVGDLAVASPPLRLKPGLPIFAEDPQQIRASWQRLLGDHALTRICPAHGKPFAAAQMRAVLGAS